MRMIMWMCDVNVTDRFMCSELYNYSSTANRLIWYGHVLRKDENDWLKNACIMKWKV